jgi:signal transduction histidine kinase
MGTEPAEKSGAEGKRLEMQLVELATVIDATNRIQMEAPSQTLASLGKPGESLAEIAHDARNMVTALGLYCDLLETPGVLAGPFEHYGSELKGLAAASRRLVEKLAALKVNDPAAGRSESDIRLERGTLSWMEALPGRSHSENYWDLSSPVPVSNLAEELRSNRNLLTALAGPTINVIVNVERSELPVRLASEDLTRILVNLVKNSVEAMPSGGRIRITLREGIAEPGAEPWLTLNVEDNGPGIPREALESIFMAGYTTRSKADAANGKAGWRCEHRGLGLSITRSIVEAAGGRIQAANRDPSGACFQIELPVRIS